MTARDDISTHDPPPHDRRPRYRVPLGMPLRDEGRRAGAVVSVLIHAIVIALLVIPFLLPTAVIARMQQGAGGAGPAGGGGGGHRGTGGTIETLRFVRIAPEPAPTPAAKPAATPPPPKIAPPLPKPVVAPPAPKPEQQSVVPAPSTAVAAVTPGANGGSGRDGTSGAGPGSGGGVGSGVGPGRGSANGPGTGGGTQANYPPTPTEFFLPPLPQPDNVRGIKFIAEFDVDSTGRVLDIKFTETPNGDYNRKLYAVLRSMRFRPGTRPDGTPIRMKAQVGYEF